MRFALHTWSKKLYRTFVICFSDLEEAAMPLDQYATLREFFVRSLKEGSRPIDHDPHCLVTGNQLVGYLISVYVSLQVRGLFVSCVCTLVSWYFRPVLWMELYYDLESWKKWGLWLSKLKVFHILFLLFLARAHSSPLRQLWRIFKKRVVDKNKIL